MEGDRRRACAARHGPLGLVHFDTHADTGTEVFGVEISHGTPMYRLVESGVVDPKRYAQIGLRGYWPGEREFAWQDERGITAFDLLWAVRAVSERLELVGAEVVEVCPQHLGSLDTTALVAERIVREMLTGIALRRRAGDVSRAT